MTEIQKTRGGIIVESQWEHVRLLPNRCGAAFDLEMSRKDWRRYADALEEGNREMCWVRADALYFALVQFGMRYLREWGLTSYQMKLIQVARLFTQDARNPNVPFTHYVTVYEYGINDRTEAKKWIERAMLNSWTKRELKQQITKAHSDGKDVSLSGAATPGYEGIQRLLNFFQDHPVDRLKDTELAHLWQACQPLERHIALIKQRLGLEVEASNRP